jgi:GntR family transcriptional repressor for pyruvate dehydrogenase complex
VTTIFTAIEHSRTADEVARQIEALILEGVLRDGDRLPAERELAADMEVSRPILRDALKALEARGLLATRPGGGTFVANIVGEVFADPMRQLIATHPKATADYLEYRREVEAVAAELAARRATPADKALLEDVIQRMHHAHEHGDFAEQVEIDAEFHNAVVEAAHNFVLLHTMRSCYRLLAEGVFYNRSKVFDLPGARDRLLAQHVAIFEAIRDGKPEEARKAAIDHIAFVERASAEAERTGEWERVSALRLRQRTETSSRNSKPRRPGVAE